MTVFDDLLAALLIDPNMAVDASWQRGTGVPVALRVLRSSPDRLQDAFGTTIIQATDILQIPASFGPVEADDTFTIGTLVLAVMHTERDADGVAQRVFCRR
ncbi:hypothetical protein KTR66_09910 [Roseococcus sp. SDR]|uniref:head-tail joining protein n=1 Tax=Roseococcus sp. SDR TaxID=2835532 RepID=UPI001BCE17FE|nr:hypothetical protein [Roseococcus sp. SDR]MBS7790312.1 hypothetical protein [Roseococcus sp. SDR]MBV1845626.1 hypothetical protein [Roseococcus sp. SDR]